MNFDISLKIKPYHGKIFKWLKDENLKYEEGAKKLGISKNLLRRIVNFRWFPSINTANINVQKKLESFFNCSIEELFLNPLIEEIKRNVRIKQLLQKPTILQKKIDLEYLPFYLVPEIAYEENFDEKIDGEKLKERFKEIFQTLHRREEEIIRMNFGIDRELKTIKEIATHFGLSSARVLQIKDKALWKLKNHSRSKELKDFYYL